MLKIKALLAKVVLFTLIGKCVPQTSAEQMKQEICATLDCDSLPTEERTKNVCGIKREGEGFRVKVFDNECELVQSGCKENSSEVYDITHDYYCKDLDFKNDNHDRNLASQKPTLDSYHDQFNMNEKEFRKENYESRGFDIQLDTNAIANLANMSNIVRVDGVIIDLNNINKSIDDFFASKQEEGIRIEPITLEVLNNTRRGKIFNRLPAKVYQYVREVPDNQTLVNKETRLACYHTCPKECPEEYKPVCGTPGMGSKNPSMVFRNHCFMDQVQCRVHRAHEYSSVVYQEINFAFCLGEQMDMVNKFLPILRTLQKLKRVRKGVFKYKVRNWKHWNERLPAEYRPMG